MLARRNFIDFTDSSDKPLKCGDLAGICDHLMLCGTVAINSVLSS